MSRVIVDNFPITGNRTLAEPVDIMLKGTFGWSDSDNNLGFFSRL